MGIKVNKEEILILIVSSIAGRGWTRATLWLDAGPLAHKNQEPIPDAPVPGDHLHSQALPEHGYPQDPARVQDQSGRVVWEVLGRERGVCQGERGIVEGLSESHM